MLVARLSVKHACRHLIHTIITVKQHGATSSRCVPLVWIASAAASVVYFCAVRPYVNSYNIMVGQNAAFYVAHLWFETFQPIPQVFRLPVGSKRAFSACCRYRRRHHLRTTARRSASPTGVRDHISTPVVRVLSPLCGGGGSGRGQCGLAAAALRTARTIARQCRSCLPLCDGGGLVSPITRGLYKQF